MSFAHNFLHPLPHLTSRSCLRRLCSPRFSTTPYLVDSFPSLILSDSSSSPQDYVLQKRLEQLKASLDRIDANPSRVWAYYSDLLNVAGYGILPVEIHRAVLKKCTPSSRLLRDISNRRLHDRAAWESPHMYEGRLQAVIRNIRATGQKPALDDYRFVLEQFAAVGHHIGAMHVYKELAHTGILPDTKTYALCLQAIARRLSHPVKRRLKEKLAKETSEMMSLLIIDMRTFRVPYTQMILDLTVRILNQTLDMDFLDKVMKWGYGVDLANPDRLPLEYSRSLEDGTLSLSGSSPTVPSPLMPLSTDMLNNLIDILGRAGNISKFIQTFEVLTHPLPRAAEHFFTSFDDDDDFGASAAPNMPAIQLPSAVPNTTSYNWMIKYLCRAGRGSLARHYLNEAINLDHQFDRVVRYTLQSKGLPKTPAPRISVNRNTFLPVLGITNRNKRTAMLRWLSVKLYQVLKRKRLSIQTLVKFRDSLRTTETEKGILPSNSAFIPSPPQVFRQELLRFGRPRPLPRPHKMAIHHFGPYSPLTPETTQAIKFLDLELHIRLLIKDVAEMEALSKRLGFVLGRTTQRMKEVLGRRVWKSKDIYISTDNTRRAVSREEWLRLVNYKARRAEDPDKLPPPVLAKSLSSSFFDSNQLVQSPPESAPDDESRG